MKSLNAFIQSFAQNTNSSLKGVQGALNLLSSGATVPFIARYRKEQTDDLGEEKIYALQEEFEKFEQLEDRRVTILKVLEQIPGLEPGLIQQVKDCKDSQLLEDLYLPYKPKRLTKAGKAIQSGLGPLADGVMAGRDMGWLRDFQRFVCANYPSTEDVLEGVMDVLAERIAEMPVVRDAARMNYEKYARLTSRPIRGKQEEGKLYKNYFEFNAHWSKASSHQILAIFRGDKEGFLKGQVEVELDFLERNVARVVPYFHSRYKSVREDAIQMAVKKHLTSSMESEWKGKLKEKAEVEAVRIFQKNLRNLLLAEPLGGKRVLAIDPGFKSGCKLVVLDEQGVLKYNETIYPHPPQNRKEEAAKKIRNVVESYRIEAVAVGDGTAGRETEQWITRLPWKEDLKIFMVNEDGASIYSASPLGRKEFPDYDVTVRGSVSIGRRLQDPLAELVKIEPQNLGVGQYQHDINASYLKKSLDQTVESVVNLVGVDGNLASAPLLSKIAGLNAKTAEAFVQFRRELGGFSSRSQFKKVPGLGPKSFEQCSGFIRLQNAKNPLDNTAVHPEQYTWVNQYLQSLGMKVEKVLEEMESRRALEEKAKTGNLTPDQHSVIQELLKPSRDNRAMVKTFKFSENIRSISDLVEGMTLPGIINNVAQFGAFVNLGIKENGLIHVSKMGAGFVSDPTEVVQLNQKVLVKVLQVDLDRKRIGLELVTG